MPQVHIAVLSRAKFCREFYADRVNPASYFASAARALFLRNPFGRILLWRVVKESVQNGR